MAKRKQSTAELIGISNFSRNGLQTKSQGEIVYFLVQPTNNRMSPSRFSI